MSSEAWVDYSSMLSPCCSKPVRCLYYQTEMKLTPEFWDDPKVVGVMLLTMFGIRRCPHCHTIIWLGNFDALDEPHPKEADTRCVAATCQEPVTDQSRPVSPPNNTVPGTMDDPFIIAMSAPRRSTPIPEPDIRNDPFVLDCIEFYRKQMGMVNASEIEGVSERHGTGRESTQAPIPELIDVSEYFAPNKMPESRVRMPSLRAKVAELHRLMDDERRRKAVTRNEVLNSLLAVIEMLDETDPAQRVIKAEGMRELGRFSDSLDLLAGMSGDWERVSHQIAGLAAQGNRDVKRIYW